MPILTASSNWLGSKSVKNGDTVKFLNEGAWEQEQYKDQEPRKIFKMSVDFKGETKDLKITKASRTQLTEAWGNNTADWVGKEATIMLIPTEKGKSILLNPVLFTD